MLDRASTFAHPEIVELLKTRFIPVAIDQAYQRRQQDTEGEFYRRIAGQSPRNDFEQTTQGNYVATAAGKLLLYNNNRDPEKLLRLLRQALRDLEDTPQASEAKVLEATTTDSRFNVAAPEGGLTVRVNTKVMGGYEPTSNPWRSIFQNSISRDNLWITASEHAALLRGQFPESLQRRIARYHLVDNTRGEPPMWQPAELRTVDMQLRGTRLTGSVRLETEQADRGYKADLVGKVEVQDGRLARFDIVFLGQFWGEGPFTRGAPKGEFPLAISFTLADGSEVADQIPPQGSRGWVDGYLQ